MGVIKSICCNNNKFSSDIIQDTIRINDQNKKSNNNKNIKESINNVGEKKIDTITHQTEENKKTIPNEKNDKINKRVSLLQNHNQRRKSISISINQINQLTNETKIKRREKKSHSTIQNLKLDLSNFKYKLKETYNQLPSNQKKLITLTLTPKNENKKNSSSSINSDIKKK